MDHRTRTRIQTKSNKQTTIIQTRLHSQRKNHQIKRNIHITTRTKRQSKIPNQKPRLLPRQNHRRPIHSNDTHICQT